MLSLTRSAAALAALFALPISAHHAGERFVVGEMELSHAYAFENAEMAHSIRVYLTLNNNGETTDHLTGAEASFAEKAGLKGQVMDPEGTLAISTLQRISIEPGQMVSMQPGGAWIELEGVQRTFKRGQHFHVTLFFANAGVLEIDVEVEEMTNGHEHEHSHGGPGA